MHRTFLAATALVALLLCAAASPTSAAGPKNHRIGEISLAADQFVGLPELQSPIRVDLDGDGVDEIVGTAAGSVWLVEFDAASSKFRRPQRVATPECLSGVVPQLSAARPISAIVVMGHCAAPSLYSGKPLQLQQRFPDAGVYGVLAVADFDGDGALEFLQNNAITQPDGSQTALDSRVYAATGQFVVGQFDADPALEIAVSTYSGGFIVDGATGLVQAERAGGFGSSLQLAELDGDAGPEFVGILNYNVVGFDPSPLRELFSVAGNPTQPGNAVTVANKSPDVDDVWIQGYDRVGVLRQVNWGLSLHH